MRRLFVIMALLCGVLKAQPPRNFYRTIGGEGDDVGYSCKVTLNGNYIVAGSTTSFGLGNSDFYLVLLDSVGNGKFGKHYGGSGNEAAKSVIQLPDSSFVMVGFTTSYGAGGYDALIIKVDKLGDLVWQKTYGGSDWDFAEDVVLGSDNNLYIVGRTYSFGNGKEDGFLIKCDMSGNILNSRFIGGTQNDGLKSIIKSNDGNIVTVGYTESRGDINGDILFAKLNLNLDTLYTKVIGGPLKDFGNDVTQHPINGEYYLCGAKTYSNYPKTRSYMHRLNASGTFLSDSNYYRNTIDESFISVCSSRSKQAPYLTGFVRTVYYPINKYQAETFIGLPAGNSYLINASGEGNDEFIYSIEATWDCGFVSVGSTNGFGAKGVDIYFMKQDSNIVDYASIVALPELTTEESFFYFVNGTNLSIKPVKEMSFARIEIVSITGQTQIQYNGRGEELYTVDLSKLNPGAYLLVFTGEDGKIVKKKFTYSN